MVNYSIIILTFWVRPPEIIKKKKTVQHFTYLGSKITYDGEIEIDIKCRIAQPNQAFYKKKHLFIGNTISLKTRKALIKSVVWSGGGLRPIEINQSH